MLLRTSTSLALASAFVLATTAPAMAGQFDHTDTSTTGTWSAPSGASVVQVILAGATGGGGASISGGGGGGGGGGAIIASSINVSVGETLTIDLGEAGTNATGASGTSAGGASGFTGSGGTGAVGGGGGGGGASVVKIGADTILISGGGGGGGGADGSSGFDANPLGGSGGTAGSGYVVISGSTTFSGANGGVGSNSSTGPGGGGTGSAGGARGDIMGSTSGAANQGGDGSSNFCGGGGGGGGYYGGGGGGAAAAFGSSGCSGGGGGSSFMNGARTGTNRIYTDGSSVTNGSVQINYIDFTTTTLADGQVGTSYAQNVIATFGAATTPDVWSVSPALPAGLSLNTSTGAISGTPTESVNSTYTITASYNPGPGGLIARSATTLTLLITAAPDPEPSSSRQSALNPLDVVPSLRSSGGPWTLRVGDPTILIPSTNSGSAARYSITPALPEGLTLNEFTGAITGTAVSAQPLTQYRLTAANSAGSSSIAFTMAVAQTGMPSVTRGDGSEYLAAIEIARDSKLSRTARRQLAQATEAALAPMKVVVGVESPENAANLRTAYKSGVAIRRFLRSLNREVSTRIELVPQEVGLGLPTAWVRAST